MTPRCFNDGLLRLGVAKTYVPHCEDASEGKGTRTLSFATLGVLAAIAKGPDLGRQADPLTKWRLERCGDPGADGARKFSFTSASRPGLERFLKFR
jgi:hypothetical protein